MGTRLGSSAVEQKVGSTLGAWKVLSLMPPVQLSCGTGVTGRQQHVLEGKLCTCPASLVVGSCAGAIPVAVQQLEKHSGFFSRLGWGIR